MKILIQRYYGDDKVTKSRLSVEGTDFECEARETRYADYKEKFPGCSQYCLAEGTFKGKIMATEFSAMTLVVVSSPGHRSTKIKFDLLRQTEQNAILVGESDGDPLDEYREMVNQEKIYRELEKMIYGAYRKKEEIEIKTETLPRTPPCEGGE
ncbi:MAG: hypothetical protein KBT29_02785 [Prevotellaceae bacterium]|nr:hypothetical protein [Candidatus Minthosoma caballi]